MKTNSRTMNQCLVTLMLGFLLSSMAGESLRAGEPIVSPSPAEDCFRAGTLEGTADAGLLFSPFLATQNRPTLNYELTEVQLGYMLTPVHGSSFYRGNVELVGSIFDGWIVEGRGTYVAGATAWLRYNFVPRSAHLVPFVEAGAGVTSTDLDRRIEGQDFNFNLNLGIGARYFITRKWSVNLEYRYQHISNGNMSSRNLGVNADGPMLGVSYFF
jgi:hypothetical protein